MVVNVKVPGNQAGEVNVWESVGGFNRFGGPRKGAGVDIFKSKLSGVGAKAAGRGVNIEVKNL